MKIIVYFQSAVRAAVEGRILVLEGIEKAERNVLPVLNNLLENREMHLEDGRLLIPSERYDKLLKVLFLNDLKPFNNCFVFRTIRKRSLINGSLFV